MYKIKMIVIYMTMLAISYAAPSGFGASEQVTVTATVPYQEPSISYYGAGIIGSATAQQPIFVDGEIMLSIISRKPIGSGNDATVFVKYPRKINLNNRALIGVKYEVVVKFDAMEGGVDSGTGDEWKCAITTSLGKETLKALKYHIRGEAPVEGKYEGRALFEVSYN